VIVGSRRTAALLSAAFAATAAAVPPAAVADQQVSVQFAAFSPPVIDALPGEPVQWSNVSPRTHTVTGLAFASGDLAPGATFGWTAGPPGAYAYHCTIHPQMVGEIDVRRVTLEPFPPAAVVAGARVEIAGRTADPLAPVRIERDRGGGFAQVGVAMPAANGGWSATVTATATADYRAVSGADASEVRRLLVSNRHVRVRAVRGGVAVSVTPSDPSGRLLLEQRLKEHFGWWPVARKRLDFVSEARFKVHRRARTRVLLVDRDGWTPIAISRAVRARP
jgi:plastocyanin